MKKHCNLFEQDNRTEAGTQGLREKLIGLGEVSIQKSYYPELQRRLKELEKFKAILNQSNDLIFFMKVPDMTIEDVNEFACHFLGYTRDEFIQLPINEFAGTHVSKWIEQAIDKIFNNTLDNNDEYRITLLTALTDKQQKKHPVEIKLKLVEWEDTYYIIAVARDISKHIEAEIKIRKLNVELERKVRQRTAQLEAANKELEAFSYSVSHDLRAPLRTINGFSQAIYEDYSDVVDDEGKDYLGRIMKATQHMGNLIDNLLLLSRSTRIDMKYEVIDLSKLVTKSFKRFQDAMHRDDKLQINVAEDIYCNGDFQLLKIAIDNLVENALKYSQDKPISIIEFGTVIKNDTTIYYIKDNGVGFNMKYYDRLFTPFQRLHKDNEFQGTGIGLATVRRIIVRHGGNIWAESNVGAGTTFYFTLDHYLDDDVCKGEEDGL
ncbi:sensor histidine kinase [Desulfuribacillus alkaliarsenatis]|uniref:histidine kinase n=1 Tax=Desulfuribacillus alkaliarsenatis TaxID=766136 RepID=A0A1E5FYP8_9FIRM|nr:ATP-binding protein [Desulfuribacillus alkaliarsenatis]OEF95621.1 hypothetical protein BHF68_12315 [Desulfuribacillus alkaliarsenatis]